MEWGTNLLVFARALVDLVISLAMEPLATHEQSGMVQLKYRWAILFFALSHFIDVECSYLNILRGKYSSNIIYALNR